MDELIFNARTSVFNAREQRIAKITEQQLARDARQQLNLTYAGWSNGRHFGRLPNGGKVPITPTSNGSIEIGAFFVGSTRGRGGTQGNWMPR